MSESSSTPPCVLVIGDPPSLAELLGALSEPLPTTIVSKTEVLSSSGGDEVVELFEARRPHVVVVTATLETGDTAALVEAVRGGAPRGEVGIVVIGDPEGGAVRNAADAADLAADRFVSRPMAPRTLRFAVASALEAVILVRASRPPVLPVPPTSPMPPALVAPVARPVPPPPPPARVSLPPPAPLSAPSPPPAPDPTREAMRRRWAELADSMIDETDELDEAAPLPPPIATGARGIQPRSDAVALPQAWSPGTTAELAGTPWESVPVREPTLILRDPSEIEPPPPPPPPVSPRRPPSLPPLPPGAHAGDDEADLNERMGAPAAPAAMDGDAVPEPIPDPFAERRTATFERARAAARKPGRARLPDLDAGSPSGLVRPPVRDDLQFDDLLLGGRPRAAEPRLEVIDDLPDEAPPAPSSTGDGRDFARQLRAKMSQMAQRLFQGADAPAPAPADLAPRHDHSTEIDLSDLGEELPLGGPAEIEARAGARAVLAPELATSPGSWDSQVRERGLPDQAEIVRGVSDAPMLLAKMFAGGSTGRIVFRRGDAEIVVFFDQGRPVFASSSETRDRMGQLLVREGKITASQWERCQGVVAESGRRMGEILVDFGYLKRRELLPAVRRHVEDILYALFGWDSGRYHISIEAQPSAERIRLSRHPASLILEGIRRKLNRTTLERLLGPPSTVIEVGDRERLGGIINMGDLSAEERAALAAFDGQIDLAGAARAADVDIADVLPLAWGLCVLGLATARRPDTEIHDEGAVLVGETDLAIDRERVRARWQLVTEADYFALLGVRRDATTFEIRRAYQAARRDFAADGFPNDLRRELARELEDIASVLDEAFRVLRDDRLRQTYLAHLIE